LSERPHRQNDQVWIGQSVIGTEPSAAHIGGNVRDHHIQRM